MYIKPTTITRLVCFVLGIAVASLVNYAFGIEATVIIGCGAMWAGMVKREEDINDN